MMYQHLGSRWMSASRMSEESGIWPGPDGHNHDQPFRSVSISAWRHHLERIRIEVGSASIDREFTFQMIS